MAEHPTYAKLIQLAVYERGSNTTYGVSLLTRVWLILLSLLSNVLALALPLTLIQVYDRILVNQAVGTAIVLFTAVVIAILLDGIVRFSRSAIFSRKGTVEEYTLGMRLARRVLSMSRADLSKFGAGREAELFAAITRSRDVLVGQSTLALFDMPFAIVFLVLVWFIAGPVVYVPLAVVAVAGLFALFHAMRNRRASKAQFEARSAHKSILVSGASGIEVFRTRGLAGDLMGRLRRLGAIEAEATERSERSLSALADVAQVASLAASIGILGVGAMLALEGELTSGGIAACLILGQRAVGGLIGVVSALARRQTASVAHRTLREALSAGTLFVPTITESSDAANDAQIALSWRLPDGRSVEIGPGEAQTIEFDTFDAAEATYAALSEAVLSMQDRGTDATSALQLRDPGDGPPVSAEALARRVVFVRAAPLLFRGTLLENITGFDASRIDRATAVGESLGLDRPISRLPNGFQTTVGSQFGVPLSAGAVKRVGLVRALSGKAGLVVLGNPTLSLDQDGIDRLLAHLESHHGSTSILILEVRGAPSLKLTPENSKGAQSANPNLTGVAAE